MNKGTRYPTVVWHVVGLALTVGAIGMFLSALVELHARGPDTRPLLLSAALTVIPGATLWRWTRPPDRLSARSIFAAVLASWVLLSVAGAVPYLLAGTFIRLDDALFEMVSGFTTTGSTVLRPIEGHSAGILFWRSFTQWIGGIGVVVLAVSVLPYLGAGGMELLSAEAPGPQSERLAPRVRETAKRLCALYLAFSVLIAILYRAFGMGAYDAVTHAFTTISTGGFSGYNASFGHFDSAGLEWIAVGAMFVAGASFALYWRAFTGRPSAIPGSLELRAYAALVAALCAAAVGSNVAADGWSHQLVRQTVFTVVSLATSTGYTMLDYDTWTPAIRLWLIFAMGLGGMAGSTTGGLKVFRLLAVLVYGRRQIRKEFHPRSVSVVRLGGSLVAEDVMARIVGFFALFVALGAIATLALAMFGAEPITAISAVAQALGNTGPGMGAVGPTTDYLNLHRGGRAVLMTVMLAGRLEIFPVILGVAALTESWRQLRRRWRRRHGR